DPYREQLPLRRRDPSGRVLRHQRRIHPEVCRWTHALRIPRPRQPAGRLGHDPAFMLVPVPDERLDRAREQYERAVFGGDGGGLTAAAAELDELEADLALARGRILHARFLTDRREDPQELVLFERAAELYQRMGNVRGEAEASFWVGCFHQ